MEFLLGNAFMIFSSQVSYCCSSGFSLHDREAVEIIKFLYSAKEF
jgi:hypothetical protein